MHRANTSPHAIQAERTLEQPALSIPIDKPSQPNSQYYLELEGVFGAVSSSLAWRKEQVYVSIMTRLPVKGCLGSRASDEFAVGSASELSSIYMPRLP